MQVNTLEAEGPILDYLVSVVLGYELEAPDGLDRQLWMVKKSGGPELQAFPIWPDDHTHRYSTDWARGGPIIDQKVTKVFRNIGGSWTAQIRHEKSHPLVNYPVLAGTTSRSRRSTKPSRKPWETLTTACGSGRPGAAARWAPATLCR